MTRPASVQTTKHIKIQISIWISRTLTMPLMNKISYA